MIEPNLFPLILKTPYSDSYRKNQKAVTYITVKQGKEKVEYMYKVCKRIYRNPPGIDEHIGGNGFIIERDCTVELLYRVGGETSHYMFHLDDRTEDDLPAVSPLVVARTINRYYKIPRVENTENYNAEVLVYDNPKYRNQWLKDCICYDRNKSYAYEMTQPFPDTTVPPHKGIIGKDEIGFNVQDGYLILEEEGMFATIIFPKMESPFKKFIEKYTKRVDNKKERDYNKSMINIATGWLSRWNIYWRATVVNRARLRIVELMDENTVFCNTDSIVSLKRRDDIPLSDKVGDFKIEREGNFAYLGSGAYQWKMDKSTKISYKRVPKSRFVDDYDILKDGLTNLRGNTYKVDYDKGTVVKC